MRRGDILLFDNHTRLGGAVKFFTHSEWGHVALARDEEKLFDFSREGSRITTLATLVAEDYRRSWGVFRDDQPNQKRQFIKTYETLFKYSCYDNHSILALARKLVFGRDDDNLHKEPFTYHCASILAHTYLLCDNQSTYRNIFKGQNYHWSQVVPDDYARQLRRVE